MIRKSFTTAIDDEIQDNFKNACKTSGLKMNEVLEAMMQEYIAGRLIIKTSYHIVMPKKKD